MNNDLKNFVSDDGFYVIPVRWESYGTVQITGVKNLQEALDVAKTTLRSYHYPQMVNIWMVLLNLIMIMKMI